MSGSPTADTESQWQTSLGLLRDLQSGNDDGWARFVHLYTPLIYFWSRRAGLQQADAADICQSVFRAVNSGINGLNYGGPDHSFRGWLWTITRNELARYFEREQGAARSVGGSGNEHLMNSQPDWIDNDEVPDVVTAESAVIRRALCLLQPQFEEHTWQAFWLTCVDEMPTATVAERLGMRENNVRQARFRILRRLRTLLELQ